uniref:Uncharacterized protein n=1 Tax=Physcomitrium patens TaxID=3218 RepID=A0A2K1K8L6_PHYPA|nr:hypothetical protein PHYPA_012015 [Physcomitrium patens]
MGMCAVRGHMLKSPAAEEDCERTPRSTTSGSSGSSYDSCSSQELLSDEVRDYFEQADPGALWQRTISRGRRCRPLSFSGIITYDIAGNQALAPSPSPSPPSQPPSQPPSPSPSCGDAIAMATSEESTAGVPFEARESFCIVEAELSGCRSHTGCGD